MFKSLRCFRKGHLFVDSRSMAGTQVCVRCRFRQPFEGLALAAHPVEQRATADYREAC